jgi:hypothetical protein
MEFQPPPGLRNPHLQSSLRSGGLARWMVGRRARALLQSEQAWIMDGGDGVRLQAWYSAKPESAAGTVVLLHGWEGSAHSNYMLGTGARLFAEGYNVFRLNFRDHGDSHHLNPGIFHSCRLDEVLNSLADMQQRTGARDWAIAGWQFRLARGAARPVARFVRGPLRGGMPGAGPGTRVAGHGIRAPGLRAVLQPQVGQFAAPQAGPVSGSLRLRGMA